MPDATLIAKMFISLFSLWVVDLWNLFYSDRHDTMGHVRATFPCINVLFLQRGARCLVWIC